MATLYSIMHLNGLQAMLKEVAALQPTSICAAYVSLDEKIQSLAGLDAV